MTDGIHTTDELLQAAFERIELAEIRLQKGDPTEYVSGRVVDRWNNQDLELRYRGHSYTVTVADDWELLRFQPATGVEKRMIRNRWNTEVEV